MHSVDLRALGRERLSAGTPASDVARDLGVSRSTVYRWSHRSFASDDALVGCWRCDLHAVVGPAAEYAYLLGQYLGDGHLVTRARVPVLRISCCTDYPVITELVRAAVCAVRGRTPGAVSRTHTDRLINLQSYWMHWPCLLPQHGPGRKHERLIELTEWQREIVSEHPWPLIRGLIHSDGCRTVNMVTSHGVRYRYPRYFFANESRDILTIMGEALDNVGVAWRYNRPNSISIARRDAVAAMDIEVGPKR